MACQGSAVAEDTTATVGGDEEPANARAGRAGGRLTLLFCRDPRPRMQKGVARPRRHLITARLSFMTLADADTSLGARAWKLGFSHRVTGVTPGARHA